jgi:ribosomal protein S18 acetylase RimI-like enzyme
MKYDGGLSMIIRPASKEDIEQIVPLMIAYIVDFYKRPNPGDEKVKQLVTHLLYHPEHGMQFVADDGDKIVGFATLYFTFSTLQVKRTAILNDLYVHSDARRQRIGESLFRYCLKYIRENSFIGMQWETAKDNHAAQSLYNKMGGHLSEWLFYEIE